jgi:hypothetical protein
VTGTVGGIERRPGVRRPEQRRSGDTSPPPWSPERGRRYVGCTTTGVGIGTPGQLSAIGFGYPGSGWSLPMSCALSAEILRPAEEVRLVIRRVTMTASSPVHDIVSSLPSRNAGGTPMAALDESQRMYAAVSRGARAHRPRLRACNRCCVWCVWCVVRRKEVCWVPKRMVWNVRSRRS